MARFFELRARTLHVINMYAGAVKFRQADVARSMKINDIAVEDELPPSSPVLRRANNGQIGLFFSTNEKTIIAGSFDHQHPTNNDLVPVIRLINYS